MRVSKPRQYEDPGIRLSSQNEVQVGIYKIDDI